MSTLVLVAAGLSLLVEPGTLSEAPLSGEQLIAILVAEQKVLYDSALNRGLDQSAGAQASRKLVAAGPENIPALAKLLQSDKQVVRANAAWVLAAMGQPEAEEALLAALEDEDAKVRQIAVRGLRTIVKPEIRKALWRMLRDESVEVRLLAAQQLAFDERKPPTRDELDNYQRSQMIVELAKGLSDDSPEVRQVIARSLGTYHDGNSLQPLLVLLQDKIGGVRQEAAAALGKSNNRGAVAALIKALDDHDPHVAGNSAASLGDLGDARATEPLLRQLEPGSAASPGMVRVTAEALGKIGDRRAVASLIKLLEHENEQVRRAAARSLGQLNDARAVQPLIDSLDPQSPEAGEILEALGQLNDERAIEPIASALFADPNPPSSLTDAVERAAPRIKHPKMVRALTERSLAKPKHHGAFIARRIVSRLTDRGFDFDAEGFERWWEEHQSEY